MDKKVYNKPELTVVEIPYRTALLVGSPEGDPSNEGGSVARRASFSTFEGEE